MTTRIYSTDGTLLEVRPGTRPRHSGAHPQPAPAPSSKSVFDGNDKTLDRTHAILNAIAEIQAANAPELLLQDGRPRVEAIERIVGFDISAEDRDAAWAIHIDEED